MNPTPATVETPAADASIPCRCLKVGDPHPWFKGVSVDVKLAAKSRRDCYAHMTLRPGPAFLSVYLSLHSDGRKWYVHAERRTPGAVRTKHGPAARTDSEFHTVLDDKAEAVKFARVLCGSPLVDHVLAGGDGHGFHRPGTGGAWLVIHEGA